MSSQSPEREAEREGLAPAPAPPARGASARLWAAALLAGVIGGVASYAATGAVADTFRISDRALKMLSSGPAPDLTLYNQEKPLVNARNGALADAVFGALMGTCLGLAGSLVGGSSPRRFLAPAAGLLLGAVFGGAVGLIAVPVFYRSFDPNSPTLLLPLLVHAALWLPVGAVAGLSFGLGLGSKGAAVRGLAGGLAGALLGTAAFELAHAMALPLERVEDALPSALVPRVLAFAFVSLSIAIAVALNLQVGSSKGRRPSELANA